MSRSLDAVHADAKGLFEGGVLDEVTMRVSQAVFAHILGVGPVTVRKWELRTKKLGGATRRLLQQVEDRSIAVLAPKRAGGHAS